MREKVVKFGEHNELIGICTLPTIKKPEFSRAGLLFINAGIVHRVGQNRLYVKISRALAKIGFCAFRFDLSGIGDSSVNLTISDVTERTIGEIGKAIDVFIGATGITEVTLIGACSGAMNAIYSGNDPRVKNIILVNPPSLDSTSFYARKYLMNWRSWFKLLCGKVNFSIVARNIRGNLKNSKNESDDYNNMYHEVIDYNHVRNALNNKNNILFVCSQWDPSLDICQRILSKISKENVDNSNVYAKVLKDGDHSLFDLSSQEEIIDITKDALINWTSGKNYNNNHRKAFSFLRNI